MSKQQTKNKEAPVSGPPKELWLARKPDWKLSKQPFDVKKADFDFFVLLFLHFQVAFHQQMAAWIWGELYQLFLGI